LCRSSGNCCHFATPAYNFSYVCSSTAAPLLNDNFSEVNISRRYVWYTLQFVHRRLMLWILTRGSDCQKVAFRLAYCTLAYTPIYMRFMLAKFPRMMCQRFEENRHTRTRESWMRMKLGTTAQCWQAFNFAHRASAFINFKKKCQRHTGLNFKIAKKKKKKKGKTTQIHLLWHTNLEILFVWARYVVNDTMPQFLQQQKRMNWPNFERYGIQRLQTFWWGSCKWGFPVTHLDLN
jgi:hypothetical protein